MHALLSYGTSIEHPTSLEMVSRRTRYILGQKHRCTLPDQPEKAPAAARHADVRRLGAFGIIWDTLMQESVPLVWEDIMSVKGKARNRMLAAMTAGALTGMGLTLVHSLWSHGPRRTAAFAALGLGLPLASEFVGVNVVRAVRHHTFPQVRGVPLVAVAWYTIGYAAHTVVEGLLARASVGARARRWALPAGTAVLATNLDLILDCFGLDLGLWEWRDGGPYAREIVGPNGKAGIPVANFVGWVVLTGDVSLGYELLAESGETRHRGNKLAAHERVGTEVPVVRLQGDPADKASAGTIAALLLLAPCYVMSAAWALVRRKPRYLAYSALVPAALVASVMRWHRH